MSLDRPPSGAERLAARHGRSQSPSAQVLVLLAGLAGATTIAGTLVSIDATSNPLWVLPVVVSGFVVFLGLLATTAWSARGAVGQAPRPVVGGGRYLPAVLLAATLTIVVVGDEPPTAAWAVPLALAGVVAALARLAGIRRSARERRTERLRSGMHVTGTVTDDGLAEFPNEPNPKLATLTVSFVDGSGRERWITPRAIQTPPRPISVGQEVDVWFDPSAPDDLRRIVVEHDNGTSRIVGGAGRLG